MHILIVVAGAVIMAALVAIKWIYQPRWNRAARQRGEEIGRRHGWGAYAKPDRPTRD